MSSSQLSFHAFLSPPVWCKRENQCSGFNHDAAFGDVQSWISNKDTDKKHINQNMRILIISQSSAPELCLASLSKTQWTRPAALQPCSLQLLAWNANISLQFCLPPPCIVTLVVNEKKQYLELKLFDLFFYLFVKPHTASFLCSFYCCLFRNGTIIYFQRHWK